MLNINDCIKGLKGEEGFLVTEKSSWERLRFKVVVKDRRSVCVGGGIGGTVQLISVGIRERKLVLLVSKKQC